MGIAPLQRRTKADGYMLSEASFKGLVHQLLSEDTTLMSHIDLEKLLEQEGSEIFRQLP